MTWDGSKLPSIMTEANYLFILLKLCPPFWALDTHVCWETVTRGLAIPHTWAKGFDSFNQGHLQCCCRSGNGFASVIGNKDKFFLLFHTFQGKREDWFPDQDKDHLSHAVENEQVWLQSPYESGISWVPQLWHRPTMCTRSTWAPSAFGIDMNMKLMLPAVLWGINCFGHLGLLSPHWLNQWKPSKPTEQLQ